MSTSTDSTRRHDVTDSPDSFGRQATQLREATGSATSDDRIDAALRQAFSHERMPEGLAGSTMARIRAARATQDPEKEHAAHTDIVTFPNDRVHPPAADDAPVHPVAGKLPITAPAPAVHSAGRRSRPHPSPQGRRRMGRRQFVTLMAVCLAAGALAAGGAVAFAGETARVEVGAGASVTLGLNRWSRVVRATASQPALQDQIDNLALTGLGCEDAVARLSSDDALCQALSDEETLVIAVTSDNASQQQSVLGMCRSATQGGGTRSMCMASDEQTVAAARQAGMGVARYEVYEQITELDPDVTLEQCRGMRMRQLRALLAEKQAEVAGSGDDNTASSANAGSDSSDSAAADAASSRRDTSAKSEARGSGMMGAGHGGKGGGPGMGMGHGGRGMGSGMGRHADAAE